MSKRKTKHYPLEFKESSAKLAADSNQPISETARALGIHVTTLHGWVNKYHPGSKHNGAAQPVIDPLQAEVKLLKKALAKVTQERDILKKAAAYFASETL
jgi:transposase